MANNCGGASPPTREGALAGVGGSLVLDEHLLTNASHDRDYDGGGELTFSGARGGIVGRGLDAALGLIDRGVCSATGFPGRGADPQHAFAAGLLIFGPQSLLARFVVKDDRPYASLFFVSEGRRYATAESEVAYDTSLTFGILGLAAAEDVQSALHHLTGSSHPEGWSHQISAGGEPTLRYSLARQAHLIDYGEGNWRGDAKWTLAGSAGTVTEASLALGTRIGRIESPFWSFAPEENMYMQETQPVPPPLPQGSSAELFGFLGARVKARAYNAFLEGQFRHSDLRFESSDLNHVLGEAWGGIEWRRPSGLSIQYLVRWESAELRSGLGSHAILWGSINIAKSFH